MRKGQLATAWWLVAVQGVLLGALSGALLIVFSQVSVPELAARLAACGPGEAPVLLSPARFLWLRLVLGGGLALGVLGSWVVLRQYLGQPKQSVRPSQRLRSATTAWGGSALLPGQARLARVLLVVVAGLHGWMAFYDPVSLDEAISYAWFLKSGPAVSASYYPFPNNHVLLSVWGAGLHQLVPTASPLLVLRLLPTLGGLGGLVASYWLLLSGLRFRFATLAWLLISLSPAMLTASVAGRGYGVVFAALLGGLLAGWRLLSPAGLPRRARRAAWVVFGSSGVVGLYAVPTHLYGLLGLLVGVGIGFGRLGGRRARLNLLHLALVGAGMGIIGALLYAPIIAVTSWEALVHNPYVQALPSAVFWSHLRGDYFPGVAGVLLGWPGLSSTLFAGVALAAPVVLFWGRLPEPTRRLGWLSYVQLVGWLVFMQGQHVLPPARTLLAVPFFLVLLTFMGGQWAVAKWRAVQRIGLVAKYGFGVSLLVVSSGGSYRLAHYVGATALPRRQSLASFRRVYSWLQGRHPRVVWVDRLPLAVFLHYEALRRQQPPLLIKLIPTLPPAVVSRPMNYVVLMGLPADEPAAYREDNVAIVAGAQASRVVDPERKAAREAGSPKQEQQ